MVIDAENIVLVPQSLSPVDRSRKVAIRMPVFKAIAKSAFAEEEIHGTQTKD